MAKQFDLSIDKRIIESDRSPMSLHRVFPLFSRQVIEKSKVQHFKFLCCGVEVLEFYGLITNVPSCT